MLVIVRKQGEIVHVGSAAIKIAKIEGSRVKLAIDAPREVLVRRDELPLLGTTADLDQRDRRGLAGADVPGTAPQGELPPW